MRYYLIIFDAAGKVIDVCKYDDELSRDGIASEFDDKHNSYWPGSASYQTFNEVC